jgi:SprT protein
MPLAALNQHGKIAGSAHLQKNLIKLNKTLFLQNKQAFIEQVIPHEVAHIICFQRFGKVKPHGLEWRSIMQIIFNIPADVTHKFDVKNVGMKEFAYRCDCSELMLSATRHNKVTRGAQRYRCQKCHTILQACVA